MAHRLNLSATGTKLCVIVLLLVSTSSSAQVVANWDWGHSLFFASGTASSYSNSMAICTDTSGGCYSLGTYLGMQLSYYPTGPYGSGVIYGFGSNTYAYSSLFGFDTAANVTSYSQTYSTYGNPSPVKVLTDKNNNVYTAGTFSGVDFRSSLSPVTNVTPGGGPTNVYVEKTGTGSWVAGAGGNGYDYVTDICTDNAMNVYVEGYYTGTFIAFGTDSLKSGYGTNQTFITKYNSSGNVVWAKGGTYHYASLTSKISSDNNGYIYFTGSFVDTFIFEGTMLINPSSSVFESYVAKMDTNGNLVWIKTFNTGLYATEVACNSKNGVYLSGVFDVPTVSLDTFTLYNNPAGTTYEDIFIAKIDSAGHVKWARSMGGSLHDLTDDLAVDGHDNGYITGSFQSESVICGPDTIYNAYPPSDAGFVIKFDSLGHVLYGKSANGDGSSAYVLPNAIAANKRGDVYITGNIKSDSLFCGSRREPVVLAPPYQSSFIAKIDSVPDCVSSVTALSTTIFCSGDSVVLNATNGAGDTYQWFVGSTAISGATNYHYTALSGGVYSVNVTNTDACVSSASISVSVNPLPALTTTLTPSPVCDSALFTYVPGSTVAGTGFEWYRAYVPGIYDLAATGSGSISETLINTTFVAISVTYVYTLTAGSCVSTASVTVTVEPMPDAGTISGANNVCVGATITMSDAAAGGVWGATNGRALVSGSGSVHGLAVGIDTVEYTATNSCSSAVASIVVTVNPLPNAGTVTGSDSLCIGDTTSLADATPGGVWSAENGNIFLSGPGTLLGLTAGTDSVFYSVSNGCGTAKASLLVNIVNCTAGVKQLQAEDASVVIYPNPAQNSLTISSSVAIHSVEIDNLLGQHVFSGAYNANTGALDIAALPGGIYLAKINGTIVRKFVKE